MAVERLKMKTMGNGQFRVDACPDTALHDCLIRIGGDDSLDRVLFGLDAFRGTRTGPCVVIVSEHPDEFHGLLLFALYRHGDM